MTTGKIIQAIRKEKGYTQKQLAEKCGLATGTIQQYELNKREPRQEQLRKIANALDVSIDYLKTGKSSNELWEEIMQDVYKASIGSTIREEREKQGLTQKELANYTGLTEKVINECEENKDLPPIEIIKSIASFLAVNIEKIVGDLSLYPELKEDMAQNPLSYARNYSNFLEACERITKTQEKSFLEDYRKLNGLGQSEARKRVNELTEIKKYTEIEDGFYE